MYSCRNWW